MRNHNYFEKYFPVEYGMERYKIHSCKLDYADHFIRSLKGGV